MRESSSNVGRPTSLLLPTLRSVLLLLALSASLAASAPFPPPPVEKELSFYAKLNAEAAHLHRKHLFTQKSFPPQTEPQVVDQVAPAPTRRRNSRTYPDTIGESVLYNDGNQRYYTVLSIGTPPQPVAVQLDTGSSDCWLLSKSYNGSSTSSTFRSTQRAFNLNYTDGSSVQGFQGIDRVGLGGMWGDRTAVSVGLEVSADAAAPPVSGVLGMGWPALATGKEPPFWMAAGVDAFSLYLTSSPDKDDPDVYGGVLTLGGPDPALIDGKLHFIPLLKPAIGWVIPLDALSVGNVSIPLFPSSSSSSSSSSSAPSSRDQHSSFPLSSSATSSKPMAALIDSGTTLISVPSALAAAFYAAIPSSRPLSKAHGFYEYPCQTELNMGVLLGGRTYGIKDEVFAKARREMPGKEVEDWCVGSLFGNGSGDLDFMILGDTFLRSFVTVFDGKRQAVGFAVISPDAPRTGPRFSLSSPNATGGLRHLGAAAGALDTSDSDDGTGAGRRAVGAGRVMGGCVLGLTMLWACAAQLL